MHKVPPTVNERQQIRQLVEALPVENTPSKNRLQEIAVTVNGNDSYSAWTMVLIGSHFWRQQVLAVPLHRRLLLLPHCLKNRQHCKAMYNADGLQCINCGHCPLGHLKTFAESLQYQVLIAEGSPAILQLLLTGKADAVLGVGCLNSLEKCFDKLQIAGIPALAVPLHTSSCQDSQTDIDWVIGMIQTPYQANVSERVLIPADNKLTPRSLQSLFDTLEPAAANVTASLAISFLKRGGKFYRPYIMLAVFNALTGNTLGNRIDKLPDYLLNTARTIEVFHKASLLHDDIEDDDPFRYGKPTLHRTHGIAAAINAGDYLLGYGYQLIAELRKSVAPEIVTEMLAVLSSSHCRLSSGQGAELHWSQQTEAPPVQDVIKFYVEKTSPAFEAAICLGVLTAVQANGVDWDFYQRYKDTFYRFTKHLGVAFQIKNDLADWQTDSANKVITGGDVLQNRPTLLRSLANRTDFQTLSVQETYDMFIVQGVFEKAEKLVRQFSDKAHETVQAIDHKPLRELLNQLIAITR